MTLKYDWVIVGAGFTGATLAERIASILHQRVLLVERRDHLGGNAYDYYDQHGLLVHKYGPHIFHTASGKIWKYLGNFTNWHSYNHKVLAEIEGKRVPLPFNINSLHALFPANKAKRLEKALLREYQAGAGVQVMEMLKNPDRQLRELAAFVYEKVFYDYTLKQWGFPPDKLDPRVAGRVPFRINRDDRYFTDAFQGIPQAGYNSLFKRMLDHEKIKVMLKTDFRDIKSDFSQARIIHTGMIDEHFNYVHGPLPYRSQRFKFVHYSCTRYQEVGTVNYPDSRPCTRSTEFKHLTGQECPGTTVVYEYPEAFRIGTNEPYYPVPRVENQRLYRKYLHESAKTKGIYFAGRLGDYSYYNMDQAVARALKLFEKIRANNPGKPRP